MIVDNLNIFFLNSRGHFFSSNAFSDESKRNSFNLMDDERSPVR